ncbi:MAG TPA: putative Ig domain-containing protein [Myxococcota bacterium]|jgi:hypothetical protein
MGRATKFAALCAALACGGLAAAGCGGDDEVARHPAGPAMAPAGQGESAPHEGAANSAPRIDSVRFDPSPPGVGQTVRAVVEATDPDGDGVRLGYVWTVDGDGVESDGEKLDLSRHLRRGAQLEVRVTASDGHAESEPFVASTQIGNRPPRIVNLTIQPAGRITAAGPITAIATGDDPDGDSVSYEYTWTVNGSPSDERGSVFPDTELKRGDIIELSVIARDEQGESEPLTSPPIEVMNAAPVIRSQPDMAGAEGVFAYQVAAVDPDGDELRYGLGKVPEGMTVHADRGEVQWTPREDQAGAHAVEIWVEDPQGARATQRFELTIGAGPVAPATPAAPAAPAESAGDQ